MTQIDRRKSYYLIFDTETANTMDDPLVYDIGFAIIDKKGKVYESRSYVIYEVFCGMRDLMKTAYYADKLPKYWEQIDNKERKIVTLFTAKKELHALCEKYNVKAIIAHNARFDYKSTTTTQRYVTQSKYRYFLPYDIEIWDTLRMARQTICKQKSYQRWARRNGYVTKNNQVRATAEVLYRYLSGNDDFIESHTGLEDVLIEKTIFTQCMRQHKKMIKRCFN